MRFLHQYRVIKVILRNASGATDPSITLDGKGAAMGTIPIGQPAYQTSVHTWKNRKRIQSLLSVLPDSDRDQYF